jgi:RNA polymerase sigma-70 factor (ECF subfamily)
LKHLIQDEGRFSAGEADPAEATEAKQLLESLYQALRELSAPLRTVTVLYYFEEFSIGEIAQVLGCRAGTVKSRLHRARALLAYKLSQEGWFSQGRASAKEIRFRPQGRYDGDAT